MSKVTNFVFLLGQTTALLQDLVSYSDPGQWLPPFEGGGILQARIRYMVPPRQGFEHLLKELHRVHCPSMGTAKQQNRKFDDND